MSQNPMSTALVANNLPIPSALGSLEAYIGAVHQVPVLSAEDEQRLVVIARERCESVAALHAETLQPHRVKIAVGPRCGLPPPPP